MSSVARCILCSVTLFVLMGAGSVVDAAPPAKERPEQELPPNQVQPPFGMLKFAGPPNMEQAPRPRFLPDHAALRAALGQNPEARALVRFTVTAKGKPRKVEVAESNDETFARLAKAFVEKIEFRQARAGGRSVACDVEMPFGRN